MKTQKTKTLVLALGESTHTHIIKAKSDINYISLEGNDAIAFFPKNKVTITHEEHADIVLQPGNYYKVNQVEYDPFLDLVRAVFD